MKNKAIVCILINLIIVISLLAIVAYNVIYVDPYMHYHYPHTDKYFYILTNERSMNDGIMRHFNYDTVVTGTSMTENFKTSEVDEIFECKSVKVPFSGGTYKEIDSNIRVGYREDKEITNVIRCLDYGKLFEDKDAMRYDLGEYPMYLYNDIVLDDEEYLFNRDVLFGTIYNMKKECANAVKEPGITSFDEYSNWMSRYSFGKDAVLAKNDIKYDIDVDENELEIVHDNIEQNVITLANEHPETTFYLFFSPYSIVYWQNIIENGDFAKQLAAEKCAIEQMLECDNIRLYSFNTCFDITTNLDNYKDSLHYGEWINTWMLKEMKEGNHRLTKDNYLSYLDSEREFYQSYNYEDIQ